MGNLHSASRMKPILKNQKQDHNSSLECDCKKDKVEYSKWYLFAIGWSCGTLFWSFVKLFGGE
tara:strand:+ start:3291 stop:3479 length:189 start_codon:yes stop_codon:yes gene_type:complete